METKSEVVVITGASAGVGRAVAREFAQRGASIGLIARGVDGLEATAAEVRELGGRALVLPCDVADEQAVENAATAVEEAFGPIDIWINNAMTTVFAPVAKTTSAEYRRVMDVIFLGYVHGTQAALKRMRPRNRGSIVQVGSALAYRSIPLQSAYCSAKHAVAGFTESLRTELLHDRVQVHVSQVHLPAMNTPQFRWSLNRMPKKPQPVPPIYQPEVAARCIAYVALHPRREFLVAPATIKAIFGDKIAAGFADHYLGWRGYKAQQTDEPANPDQPSNLWHPVSGDHGAHGVFDQRARKHSVQAWANRHRVFVTAMLALSSAAAALIARRRRRRSPFATLMKQLPI